MISHNLFTVAIGALAIFSTFLVQPSSAWIACIVDDCDKCMANPSVCGCWNPADVEEVCKEDPVVTGDPHFKTWAGESFDFHGICDLVMVKNNKVTIHLRTKKTYQWSYVFSASVQIGNDILEVQGGDENKFWINKEPGMSTSNIQLGNYAVEFNQLNDKSRQFLINFGDGVGKISIKTWNTLVSVRLTKGSMFENSRGLMGSYPDGLKVPRSSDTLMEDYNAFGLEWQVRHSEPELFHRASDVTTCEIPTKEEMRRQLSEATISIEDAEIACSRVSKEDFDLCVFDVMATNDKESAGAY